MTPRRRILLATPCAMPVAFPAASRASRLEPPIAAHRGSSRLFAARENEPIGARKTDPPAERRMMTTEP